MNAAREVFYMNMFYVFLVLKDITKCNMYCLGYKNIFCENTFSNLLLKD